VHLPGQLPTTIAVVACGAWLVVGQANQVHPSSAARYNVVWTTPSHDASGAMPIGNGEVGLNVWVEEGGDLLFYIARTDAWSEISRLLKLGRVRIALSPNPFTKGAPFSQELNLGEGRIDIAAGASGKQVRLSVFVDPDHPVVHVLGESDQPLIVRAGLEVWRSGKRQLTGHELASSWTMREAPPSVEVWESGDIVEPEPADGVTWYHRNAYSVVPMTLERQGLSRFAASVTDPLLGRTFGGRLLAEGFVRDGPSAVRSAAPTRRFRVRVATHSSQTPTVPAWKAELDALAARSSDPTARRAATARWWTDFWNRSWIGVDGAEGESVTRAYVLQRWMTAGAGRGRYPVKFNGSLFTVDPQFTEGPPENADWRRWGDCYWWQNTRLPYFAMAARGDFDQLASVFRMYSDVVPLCRARVTSYFGADGVAFPETMTVFGTWGNGDYGWDRTGHQPNEVLNDYVRHIWQPGLELTTLMLDYYEHTLDTTFLEKQLLPMAHDVLRYFHTRFARDAAGRLVIQPTQSVETYWYEVVNDTPTVAGLRSVLARLQALPPARVPAPERDFWRSLEEATPPLPIRSEDGQPVLLPAERFNPKRTNVENPELYAIWPFGLLGVGRPDLQLAVSTFNRRAEKASVGWQYDGQTAAAVGLADESRRLLLGKVANANPRHRFPAMWGPNYDWLPDQDHGANIMLTLQGMLLRPVGGRIYLLPAWPKGWNAQFKLHAPARTVVEGRVIDGELVDLRVTPSSRRKDVTVWGR